MSRTGGDAQKKEPGSVLLISKEPFLLAEAEKEWRDRLIGPGERELNFLALYGWEANVGQVLEFLQTLPFLGNRRLLVLREIHQFPDWKKLLDYLKDPNPSSVFLMTSSQLKRNDGQFRALSPLTEVSELRRPAGQGMLKWVVDRFSKEGKKIDPLLCEVLIQKAGDDLAILATEIEKVILISGERGTINEEDLSVSVPGGVEVVFTFLDALGDGDSARALGSLKTLLDSDNPPEYLLHMIAWHYRQLIRGWELVQEGLSPPEAAVRMGKKFSPLKEKFTRHLRRAGGSDLVGAMAALAACDRNLKGGRIPPETLLDRLVLELLL